MAKSKDKAVMSVYSDFEVDTSNPNSSWTIIYNSIKNGSKVLDIGCSSGYFAKKLRDEKNCLVDGVEIDQEDASRAVKNCRTVVRGNFEDRSLSLDELDNDYDYILFIDVLEHLLDPSNALKRAGTLMRDNGRIVASIPNMANGSVRLQLLQGNFDYEKEGLLDATHLHYYSANEISKVVQKSGLVATKAEYTTFNTNKLVIDEVLKGVGLSGSEKFYKFINSADSLVYQYVIEIRKSGKPINLIPDGKIIKPKIDYEKQLHSVQADSRRLYDEKIQKDTEINDLYKQINEKDTRIMHLEDSLNRRFTNKIINRVRKVLRSLIK